jgi:hypothetical protein
MRLSRKEIILLVPATLLGLAGLAADDPWIVAPCLCLSFASFLSICWFNAGSKVWRIVAAIVITIALFAFATRLYHRHLPHGGELQARIIPYYPDTLLHIDEKVIVKILWYLHGSDVAKAPRMSGRIYLVKRKDFPEDEDSRRLNRPSLSMQKHVVDSWKADYAEMLRKGVLGEGPSIYLDAPGAGLAEGPVVTQEDADGLKSYNHSSDRMLFVIGAVRFSDSAGEHEAHACAWLQGASESFLDVSLTWMACQGYGDQIDIK